MPTYTMGVDIGSTTSKCVILKDGTEIVSTSLIVGGTGTNGQLKTVEEALGCASLKMEDISAVIATGYGRKALHIADNDVSELSCHAKGVHFLFPDVRTIIDIGGQDAKVLRIGSSGKMTNFVMNDKCAAGTGRFLDVMANILALNISDLEKYAADSDSPVSISNTCTVFAESEVISQLASNAKLSDIIAGICNSVAGRVASLAKRVGIEELVFFSGGVALNNGVRRALEHELNTTILTSPLSQLMGAVGAALYAYGTLDK